MKRAAGLLGIACLCVGLCLAAEFQSDEGKRLVATYTTALDAARTQYVAALTQAQADASAKDAAALTAELKRLQAEPPPEPRELKADAAQKPFADYEAAVKAARTRFVQDLLAAQRSLQIKRGDASDAEKAAMLEEMNRLADEEKAMREEIRTGKARRKPATPPEKSNVKLECRGTAKAAAGDTYVISGDEADRLWTAEPVAVPFKARIVAKTDSSNLRVFYGKGSITFNGADTADELRTESFSAGQVLTYPGLGKVAPNEWAVIDVIVSDADTEVLVNGKRRFRVTDACHGLKAKLGIGPGHDSVVTVKAVVVTPLKAEPAAK